MIRYRNLFLVVIDLHNYRNQLAENKKYADEFACNSSDECMKIEDKIRKVWPISYGLSSKWYYVRMEATIAPLDEIVT